MPNRAASRPSATVLLMAIAHPLSSGKMSLTSAFVLNDIKSRSTSSVAWFTSARPFVGITGRAGVGNVMKGAPAASRSNASLSRGYRVRSALAICSAFVGSLIRSFRRIRLSSATVAGVRSLMTGAGSIGGEMPGVVG
jgi:hypothetical protein